MNESIDKEIGRSNQIIRRCYMLQVIVINLKYEQNMF